MIETIPEPYHCLGVWLDLLGTEDRFAADSDVAVIGQAMGSFYDLCSPGYDRDFLFL